MEYPSISVIKKMHPFRNISLLKNEAKGNYLEAVITDIPENVTLELSLADAVQDQPRYAGDTPNGMCQTVARAGISGLLISLVSFTHGSASPIRHPESK